MFLQKDMCFWNVSKYKIYENQPAVMLGTLGPDVYKSICPKFLVTEYELVNGKEKIGKFKGHKPFSECLIALVNKKTRIYMLLSFPEFLHMLD